MDKWQTFRKKSGYSPSQKSRKFESILKKVEKEYPNRSGSDQFKIAMGIFKKTKYYR
jgi:hypothetical protein